MIRSARTLRQKRAPHSVWRAARRVNCAGERVLVRGRGSGFSSVRFRDLVCEANSHAREPPLQQPDVTSRRSRVPPIRNEQIGQASDPAMALARKDNVAETRTHSQLSECRHLPNVCRLIHGLGFRRKDLFIPESRRGVRPRFAESSANMRPKTSQSLYAVPRHIWCSNRPRQLNTQVP
jgi:hypothetical protein